MADPKNETEDTTTPSSSTSAEFREWLAKHPGLSPVAVNLQDEAIRSKWDGRDKLSDDRAYDLVGARLGWDDASKAPNYRKFIDFVLLSLPREAWTEELLVTLDLRPFVANYQTFLSDRGVKPSPTGEGTLAKALLNGQERLDADVAAYAEETATTDAERARTYPYVPNTATLEPRSMDAYAAAQAAYETGAQGNAPTGDGSTTAWADVGLETSERPTVDGDVIRRMLATGQDRTIMAALDATQSVETNPDAPRDVINNEVGLGMLGPNPGRDAGRGKEMPLLDAAQFLTSSDARPAGIARVQKALIEAGYGDGLPMQPVMGDGFDEVTNVMWQRALGEAYMRKIPLDQLLEEKKRQRESNFSPISTTADYAMLDNVARNMLGRSLDRSEMNTLVQTLYGLKDKQVAAPNADGSGGTMGEGSWYTQDDVAEAVLNQEGGEVGGQLAARAVYEGTKMVEGLFS